MTATYRRKHPRTFHHPLSTGVGSDDKVATDLSALRNAEVVVTEKTDGENTTLYRGGFHARSPDSGAHPARSWLAAFHAGLAPGIPGGWRVCGENVFARHAVAYDALPGYFLGFSAWDGDDGLDWEATTALLDDLGIPTVPVLHRGRYSDDLVRDRASSLDTTRQEGFVVRTASGFPLAEFGRHVGKWVRPGHVQPDAAHWSRAPLTPNGLAP